MDSIELEKLMDNINISDSDDNSDDSCHGLYDDTMDVSEEVELGISKKLAKFNYELAGTEVREEKDAISIDNFSHLLLPEVGEIIARITARLNLPYKHSDFQVLAVNVLCAMKHLILISPTGSGKMDVPFLTVLVLRELLNIPKGICIVTQPLTSIMVQKMENKLVKVAVLSMGGNLKTALDEKEEDATLSCKLEDLLAGNYEVLIAHPESFETSMGQAILEKLMELGQLVLVCIDEFHVSCKANWASFR